ncbi:hypothetical protein VPH35_123961 [Triticum aestivum]
MLSCKDINKYESLISAHNFASQEAPPGGAPATSNFASSGGWTDLPSDLLGRILQLLELLEALAAAAVCTSWCSAAAAAGVPRGLTPWLISWKPGNCRSSEFRNLIGTRETHKVSLPTGRRNPEWCGASHGWLVASDELSKTLQPRALPPLHLRDDPSPAHDRSGVKGVYDADGGVVGYRFGKYHQHEPSQPGARDLGTWFYQKVALSCDPSAHGGDYTAVAIHYDANCFSFTRARKGRWRLAAALPDGGDDRYADCVHHGGRFYTVTLREVVEAWDLCGPGEPRGEAIIADGDRRHTRTLRRTQHPREIKMEVLQVDVEERRLVALSSLTALRGHAVFVGLNHSACLPVGEFPELRPNYVYFSTPRLKHHDNFGLRGWSGVRVYDLESQTIRAFPGFGPDHAVFWPSELWYILNLSRMRSLDTMDGF